MSRRANTRISKLSLLLYVLPRRILLLMSIKLWLSGEIEMLHELFNPTYHFCLSSSIFLGIVRFWIEQSENTSRSKDLSSEFGKKSTVVIFLACLGIVIVSIDVS